MSHPSDVDSRDGQNVIEILESLCRLQKKNDDCLFVRCGKGTYIRSIARDLGEQLSVGAHLIALRRLRVGQFTADLATNLLMEEGPGGGRSRDRFDGPPRFFSLAESLTHLPVIVLPGELVARVRNGQKSALSALHGLLDTLPGEGQAAVALDETGDLVALVTVEDGRLVIGRGFSAPG